VANKRYQSEELANRLTDAAGEALRKANFNGYGWALIAPSNEVFELLLALKLVSLVKGQMVITNVGMSVRAVISRKAPSARFVFDGT
jgi:hypothetical protein